MAFGQPLYRQLTSLENTVRGDCFLGVSRATGIKTAVIAQERAQGCFVAVDQEN
jgi:hypothetical protein